MSAAESKQKRNTRFGAGKSGNPRGRPRGAQGKKTILEYEMRQRVTIPINGVERSVTQLEALLRVAIKGHMEGRPRYTRLLETLNILDEYEPLIIAMCEMERKL